MKLLIIKMYFYDIFKKYLSICYYLNCIYVWFGFLINVLFYCFKILYIFLFYCLYFIELVGVIFVRIFFYI